MKKHFKDFWTNDLKQFYDESWGQENFNHEKVQSFMPAEPEKWEICPADRFFNRNKRKRAPFCRNCKERGHMHYECLKRQILKCEICGLRGHIYYMCPNALCTTCRSASKTHTSSCYNCRRVQFMQCSLCKALGHEMQHCPDLWRRYHQTTTYNKMLKQSKKLPKNQTKLWCSNCANQGHPADKCRYPCEERILSTTEIFSYEATYDNEFKLDHPSVASTIKAPKKHTKIKTKEEKTEKFRTILKKLKKDCNKSDSNSLKLINQYLRDIKKNKLTKKLRKKVNKLRDKIKNS